VSVPHIQPSWQTQQRAETSALALGALPALLLLCAVFAGGKARSHVGGDQRETPRRSSTCLVGTWWRSSSTARLPTRSSLSLGNGQVSERLWPGRTDRIGPRDCHAHLWPLNGRL